LNHTLATAGGKNCDTIAQAVQKAIDLITIAAPQK